MAAAALDSKLSKSAGNLATLTSQKHDTIVEERTTSPTKAPEATLASDSKAKISPDSKSKMPTASKSNISTDSKVKASSGNDGIVPPGDEQEIKSPVDETKAFTRPSSRKSKKESSETTDKEAVSVIDSQCVSIKDDDVALSEAISTDELLPPVIVTGEVCDSPCSQALTHFTRLLHGCETL